MAGKQINLTDTTCPSGGQMSSRCTIESLVGPKIGIARRGRIGLGGGVKMHFLIAVVILGACGCASDRMIPVPTAAMAAKSGADLAVLQKGYGVYMAQCTRCHEPMMPSEVSKDDWHIVTPGMAWNAGISEAEEDAVLKYILAAR